MNKLKYANKIIFVDSDLLDNVQAQSEIDFQKIKDYQKSYDTIVVNLPIETKEEEESILSVTDPSLVRPGAMVVKSQWTDQFVALDDFEKTTVHRKLDLFVQLCIILGAKGVSVCNQNYSDISALEKDNLDVDIEAKISGKKFSGVDFNKKSEDEVSQIVSEVVSIDTVARGGAPNLQVAWELICTYGLQKDSMFCGIYNMMRNENNRLIKYDVILDFKDEMKKVFNDSTKAEVDLLLKYINAAASLEKNSEILKTRKTALTIKLSVEFSN